MAKIGKSLSIRIASPHDAAALLRIYGPYVEKTAITFEYEVPSVEEFQGRIAGTLEKYPYLIAEEEGRILGYAYAGSFHPRKAYEHSAELSIYLAPNARYRGIGKKLYARLEEILARQQVYNLYACIAFTEKEDPFLPKDSPLFHEHMGFQTAGRFHHCGYKFHRWYDMIWMEKFIGNRTDKPGDFVAFSEL